MEGVEILSSAEVEIAWTFNWNTAIITFLLCFIALLFIGFIVDKDCVKTVFLPCGLAVGLFAGGLCGIMFGPPTEYVMEHKVIISEEVSLQDFVEKYEIVGQEGKIYIVREK